MAKIVMTEDILNIINCVIAYKKFITIYHRDILHESEFDFISETRKFLYTLPMPEGMQHNNINFEAILRLSEFNWINF